MSTFDPAYAGVPPWDVAAPQKVFVDLESDGQIGARVLDAGCGTGENALYLAACGHEVVGIDDSPRAIAKAQSKARDRGLALELQVADALSLESLRRRFDTVIDSGLFHVFDDRQRLRYVRGLGEVVVPGGSVHMLCFSEEERSAGGPRRVNQHEIRAAFSDGWNVRSIKQARFASNSIAGGAKAWLASVSRRGAPKSN